MLLTNPAGSVLRLLALVSALLSASDSTTSVSTRDSARVNAESTASAAREARATAAGTVVAIASMSAPRAAHTATTLRDGRVLLAGGFIESGPPAQSAQLYDARSNRFLSLPRMVTVRHSHTATLLPNGKVLLSGGYATGADVTTAAELFDPTTGTFTATGAMRSARAGHVAVLLNNGKVLIAGGVGANWSFLSSAELYDPATGQFSPTGAMTEARESHAAARLLDGRVLIAGGHRDRRDNIKLYTSAEVYDATAGVFKRVGDMNVRRHKHDAVLLQDGRVLVTGGSDERDDKGAYNSTELFDPKTGAFTTGPVMQRARYKHNGTAVTMPNGVVLIAGGAPEAETFDPATLRFSLVSAQSLMAGQFSAAARIGNGALITGGYGNGTGPRASAWVYRAMPANSSTR